MAYRQRIKDEEIARVRQLREAENYRIKQEQIMMIEELLAIEAEKDRIRMNKLIDEMILKQEVRKSEDHQRELERQKQQEIERQEKAEKDRIAKEAKDAKDAEYKLKKAAKEAEYKLKQAAREAEDAKIAMIIRMCAPLAINGISNALTNLFGGQNKENTKEQENANTNPPNDPAPEAD